MFVRNPLFAQRVNSTESGQKWEEKSMRKKSKKILAAALAAISIWNTCEWKPQALAAGLLHRIEEETGADDTAETAVKETSSNESVLKASPSNASPSNAEVKNDGDEPDTGVLPGSGTTVPPEANEDEAGTEAGTNGAPNGTATGAEIKTEIEAFLELDEAIAVQKFSLGAKESDIILPDTLEVRMKQETLEDAPKAERELQIDAEADAEKENSETDVDEDISRISGVTWKLDINESDYPEFHGGISPQDYFEEFNEDGEPIETSDKTWNSYYEANQDYNGCAYVYTPVLPEEYPVGEEAELPEICVLVGEMQLMTLAGEEHKLNNSPLIINSGNVNQLNGKTITGSYCPSTRPNNSQYIKGGITIDNVTVDLTIKDVTIQSGGAGAGGWDLAGIYLKGNAQLNLTLEGDNTLLGLEHGAGIEVEKGATLVITEQSNGSLKAVGGAYGTAGIGGGTGGGVDTIVIGGANGKAPDITVSSYNSAWGYLGAAIGSGWNGVNGLQLSCGDIQILSGSVEVTGGNIGYGVLRPLGGNSMKGGSITISEKVQLKLPVGSNIEPRGDCTYGQKTFRIAAYDNQLPNGTYLADISLYREDDTEKATPVYVTSTKMTVSGFRGAIPDITQWIGHSGNMQMVVKLSLSGGGTGKTMEGAVVLHEGMDETISVTLGKNAYQKTMDLTIHDGRLKNDKNYTLTVQIGKEASEGGTAPDVVTYLSQKASGYQIKTDKVSWYTPLFGEVPVSVQVQEEGENTNGFTVTGTLTMKSEEETTLSLTIGEPLYPARFHFYSSKVQVAENVVMTVERLESSASEASVELKQEEGQFVFDGKLTIDAAAGNHAYAQAYLPAGNYRFVINTGITELGSSGGSFTLDSETVEAKAVGTDITVLNAAEALEGELDLSLGNISFSEENGQLTILYSKTDDSGKVVKAKLIDQSYEKCYRITSSGNNVEKYHLSVDTPASGELKLVLKSLTITPAEAIAPIQINGESHVTTYLEGENRISINKSKSSSGLTVSPAGISVAKDAKLTIDSEPEQPGSIKVLNETTATRKGAGIGSGYGYAPGNQAITAEIEIHGGMITAYSEQGACIGSGRDSSSKVLIDGGTICLGNKNSRNRIAAHIGMGESANTQAQTDVEISGGTICLIGANGFIPRPIIYGWEMVDGKWQQDFRLLILVEHRFQEHGSSVRIRAEGPLPPFIRR